MPGEERDRHNADPFNPITYLVAFLLANSETASFFYSRATYNDIYSECSQLLGHASQESEVTPLSLIHYLDYFAYRRLPDAHINSPVIFSEHKQAALMSTGLNTTSLAQINSITNSLIHKYAA